MKITMLLLISLASFQAPVQRGLPAEGKTPNKVVVCPIKFPASIEYPRLTTG